MDIRKFFFRYRSYTPIPLILLAVWGAKPSWVSLVGGFLLVLLGESVRFWGVAYAGPATRTTQKVSCARLVTEGPYAYVRNPLYSGNFFVGMGFFVMAWAWMPWMLFAFFVLFLFQYSAIVHLEEEFLLQKFGKKYRTYQKQVPRWIPRRSSYQGNKQNSMRPDWKMALRSERNTLQTIGIVILCILFRWQIL